jgi:hypothetical protein
LHFGHFFQISTSKQNLFRQILPFAGQAAKPGLTKGSLQLHSTHRARPLSNGELVVAVFA